MLPEGVNLSALLAKRIEQAGPISVAHYMEAANRAYYAKGDPLGAGGDFITSPEISQVFGELIGLWLTDIWIRAGRPENCTYVELGPGRGTLAADALRSMEQHGFRPQVLFIETSPALRAIQAGKVPQAQFADVFDQLPTSGPLLVVGNEFFDALPVHQYIATHAGWRERVVVRDRGGKFMATPGLQSMDAMVPEEFRNAPSHSIYEACPKAIEVMQALAKQIEAQGGAVLVIDYGYTMPGIGDTLQAVRAHEYANPFENPGQNDLTAHVDFAALVGSIAATEITISGPVEQGEWLKLLGIDYRINALAAGNPDRSEEILAARDRLVESSAMGSLFKVLGFSHPHWPKPEGFDRIPVMSAASD